MAKVDDGFKQSEKMLNDLERRIHKEYAQAKKEMGEKVDAYFAKFEKENYAKEQAVKQGRMSVKEYNDWRMRKMATGKQYIAMRNTLAKDLTNTDKIAMKIVNQSLPDVYALNMNYGTYSIEKDSKINTSFTLYNHAAVERLIKDNPKLLPSPKVDIPKDLRWNQQHIQSAITQGILQGKSIPKIAEELQRVTGMDENAAIRNARTAMTGAQNAGRLDSMKRAAARGIGVKKGWLSTLDNVTRDSHVDLDGEVQELDRAFSNGLMYPGDASGPPAEVYNCFIPETKIGVDSKIIRSYKHRYEGEIISIKSALGVNLSCTPNHPILTDRGWVAAKFLNEGDNLIVTSCIDNEVSRRNPNINHAFPRIDTIHQLFDIFGGKRTSDLRVNFHGDIPTSEVEIITQKGFLWSDRYASIRKCVNKFLLKYTDTPLMRKCSFVKHFGRILRTTFGNISGVCKSFPFIRRCVSHSHIHGLRTIADSNVIFGKNTLNNLPTNVVLPSEIKNRLASKVFLDNVVSVERSNFSGHVYNLQTDDNYYFVNSSITNNNKNYNGIMAIAHNCRCRLTHEYDKYKTDWSNPANRNTSKLGNMTYQEWKDSRKGKATKIVPKAAKAVAIVKGITKSPFVAAQTISQAESFTQEFVQGGMNLTGKQVSFKGIDIEMANAINETLNDVYWNFDIDKLASVEAFGKANKKIYQQNQDAPFFTTNFGNLGINSTILKDSKTLDKYNQAGKESFELVMNNIDKLTGKQKEIAQAYQTAGKSLVGNSVEDMVRHEIGHHISYMPSVNKELAALQKSDEWKEYAKNISGYANHSFGEYVAESFNSYCKGKYEPLQPDLIAIFDGLRRK